MANSLVYGQAALQLLSGAGGQYNVTDENGSLGDPQAVVESVRAQLTMGSAVVGEFTDNRHVNLLVLVSAANGPSLTAACEALAVEVDRPVNTLAWAPDGAPGPTVFDTWRGQVTTQWSGKYGAQFARVMRVEFDALPFGRSDVLETISGTSSSVALADFSTPSDFEYVTVDADDDTLYPDLLQGDPSQVANVPMTATTHTPTSVTSSPVPFEGDAASKISANWYESQAAYSYQTTVTEHYGDATVSHTETVNVPARGTAAATLTPTGDVALDLSGATGIVAAVYCADYASQAVYLELTDGTVTKTLRMAPVTTPAAGRWNTFRVDVAGSGLTLSAITGWSLTVAVGPDLDYATGATATDVVLGQLRGFPASSSLLTTNAGSTLLLTGVKGSARSPASIRLDLDGDSMSDFVIYRAPRGSTAPPLVHMSGTSRTGDTIAPTEMAGTFLILLGSAAGDGASQTGSGLIVTQKVGGSSAGSKTLTAPGSSATAQLFPVGEISLPLKDVADEVDDILYEFAAANTVTYATLADAILLDTRGFFVVIPALSTARKYIWIDAASAENGFGGIWGGDSADRSDAVSLLGEDGIKLAGVFSLDPGDDYVMAWSSAGVPNVKVEYYPRWLHERAS